MFSEAIDGLLNDRARFLRFVERRVRNLNVAEDILQTAYIRALSPQAALRSEESAIAWFYRILRNAIIDYYRHRTVEERILDPLSAETETSVETHEPAPGVCSCIHGALDKMRPAYREILSTVDLADDVKGALSDFAAKAGITAGNAAVRAHRARRALKEQLLQTCGACAQAACLDCTCV
jgi:RNA polymerase sigma factor (sigma-70 family)